jgi:hypothetical protein
MEANREEVQAETNLNTPEQEYRDALFRAATKAANLIESVMNFDEELPSLTQGTSSSLEYTKYRLELAFKLLEIASSSFQLKDTSITR